MIDHYATHYPSDFGPSGGKLFIANLGADGDIKIAEPQDSGDDVWGARISVRVMKEGCDTSQMDPDYDEITFRFEIPISVLFDNPGRFNLYSVAFDVLSDDPSFDQLRTGYIGITKRAPIARLREHWKSTVSGRGSILHSAWRGLTHGGMQFHPVFTVANCSSKTIDDVYALEEYWVDKLTLAPIGLNAIPGGHAGIRFLQKHNLLNGRQHVSPADRDDAIDALLSICGAPTASHFRRGHVRRLSEDRTTWVRSCWVNLDSALAA